MAILGTVSKGVKKQKPTIILYGAGGLGKDTFFSGFPDPFFVDVENGTGNLDVRRSLPKAFDDVTAQLKAIEPSDCQTLVLSGLDTLEKMLFKKIVAEDSKGAKNMVQAAGGYGNAYRVAIESWVEMHKELHRVRDQDKYIGVVCHELVYSYNDPTAASYDRYRLNLHEGSKESAAKLWFDWADIVLFAKKKIYQKDENRAIDEGKHYIYTQGRAAFDAKSRYPLPFEMELNAAKFLEALNAKPKPADEVYSEVLGLIEKMKDANLKEKAKAKLETIKANASEMNVLKETVNSLLAKE